MFLQNTNAIYMLLLNEPNLIENWPYRSIDSVVYEPLSDAKRNKPGI